MLSHENAVEIELTYKSKVKSSDLIQIKNSQEAAEVLRSIIGESEIIFRENFVILCLNRQMKVLGFYRVSVGGTAGTVVDAKIIFTCALNCNAHKLIVCHNHPSGTLKPSQADIEMTKKLKQGGGALLDIDLVEHIILADTGFYSMADEGLI